MRVEPGIYLNMPEADYFAAEGLSNSGMKQLAVSELNYWHHNLNPDREPADETPAQRFGTAVHCRLLELERYAASYAAALSRDDFPDALETVDELKAYCESHGLPTGCKRKQELIDRIHGAGLTPVIWDAVRERHAEATAGRLILSRDDAARIERLAVTVGGDPYAAAVLTGGMPEVSVFVREPESGVLLKSRLDYVRPRSTIDVKTFTNSRGKPIDRTVFDALYWEGYYQQAVFYHTVRELARQGLESGELTVHGPDPGHEAEAAFRTDGHGFLFLFVESDEPHDLRMVALRPSEAPGADQNVYWTAAAMRIADAVSRYAECRDKYGSASWRQARPPHVLADSDIPQLLFT